MGIAELGWANDGDCGSKSCDHVGVGDSQEGPVAGGCIVVEESLVG